MACLRLHRGRSDLDGVAMLFWFGSSGWSFQCDGVDSFAEIFSFEGPPTSESRRQALRLRFEQRDGLQLALGHSHQPFFRDTFALLMASLCTRCALRILRSAASEPPALRLARPFSSTTSRNAHAIPQFSQTSNAELDDVLATMRNKHFLPAALTPAQRKLIFGHSKRDELASNPQAVDIAGERFQLQWMDRRTEIPNRTKLFRRAVRLMAEHGGDEAWRNLIQLLIGLHRSGVTISRVDMERLLRIAVDHGRFDSILQCMRKAEETGITLTRPEVLGAVLLALRKQGRKDDWSQESIERAMAQGRLVAQLLEMEKHGASEKLKENDLRKDPRVIGVYLELSAVFAWRHQDGKDADGRVRAYTERLLYNLAGAKEVSLLAPAFHVESANFFA